jgi:hypothetical protein
LMIDVVTFFRSLALPSSASSSSTSSQSTDPAHPSLTTKGTESEIAPTVS